MHAQFTPSILSASHKDYTTLCLNLPIAVLCFRLASEKENEELKNKENTIHEVDSYNAQEDEGDWEQVGPKNKSTVTRMVRNDQMCCITYKACHDVASYSTFVA